MPIPHRLKTTVFGYVGHPLIRFICRSNRVTLSGLEGAEPYVGQGRCIFAFWHSRIFFMIHYYSQHGRIPRVSTLISMSRDGDYAAVLVERFGQDAVRGSSSRGGSKAIRTLATRLSEGYNVALTPDGPRGPAFQVQDGVIRLAQVTGARIIPASYDASRKWTLKSWDRFILPKPFGRIHLAVGEPICVPREASGDEGIVYRKKVQDALLRLDGLCADRVR